MEQVLLYCAVGSSFSEISGSKIPSLFSRFASAQKFTNYLGKGPSFGLKELLKTLADIKILFLMILNYNENEII